MKMGKSKAKQKKDKTAKIKWLKDQIAEKENVYEMNSKQLKFLNSGICIMDKEVELLRKDLSIKIKNPKILKPVYAFEGTAEWTAYLAERWTFEAESMVKTKELQKNVILNGRGDGKGIVDIEQRQLVLKEGINEHLAELKELGVDFKKEVIPDYIG